ncbi:MAG: EamA family transporter RarD [Halieaceae bacterium]
MTRSLLLATIAYLIWGFAALYWVETQPVSALDLVAQRAVWSMPVLLLLLLYLGRLRSTAQLLLQRKTLLVIGASATAQACNWGLFLWAVTHNRATEASLGYFLLPLINVALGIFLFRETIDRPQFIAICLAALGMLMLIVENGGLPWVALGVAVSFGLYGAIRKAVTIGTVEGLAMETSLMFPLALAWLWLSGWGGLGQHGPRVDLFLLGSGVITVVPLLCYVAAAQRLPLTAMGLVFYLGPSCQLYVAVCLFGEPMNPVQLASFALVWLGLAIVAADSLRRMRSVRALARE